MLPDDGEVSLHDVVGWVQEQQVFLAHPADALLLWYLSVNAFRSPNNPEHRHTGDVLSAYANLARMQRGTGRSRETVRRSLGSLQEQMYILADMKPGNGKSRVSVFWGESADARRADARDGIRPLPEGLKKQKKVKERHLSVVSDRNILQFPIASP